jgi:hypothetical protein
MRGRKNLTSEEVREFQEAMASVDFNDAGQRRALAEVIVKELRDWIEKDDILAALKVDIQTFLPGQTVQWITRKGVKAFVHEPGSYAPRSTIANKTTTLSTEMISVNPEIEIGQLRSGRYGTIQDIKDMAMQELLSRKYGIIWSTLIGSISAGNASQYWTAAKTVSAAAKKNAVDSGFDYVADKTEVTAIIGRRTALSWMADYSAWSTTGPSENMKNQLETTTAYPQSYRGVPVIMLNQYTDGWGTDVITADNVMILGRDTVKLGVDRPLDFMEEINIDTLMWHIHIFESYGTAVFFPERNARIYWS